VYPPHSSASTATRFALKAREDKSVRLNQLMALPELFREGVNGLHLVLATPVFVPDELPSLDQTLVGHNAEGSSHPSSKS
jgi:hypothetical protein